MLVYSFLGKLLVKEKHFSLETNDKWEYCI